MRFVFLVTTFEEKPRRFRQIHADLVRLPEILEFLLDVTFESTKAPAFRTFRTIISNTRSPLYPNTGNHKKFVYVEQTVDVSVQSAIDVVGSWTRRPCCRQKRRQEDQESDAIAPATTLPSCVHCVGFSMTSSAPEKHSRGNPELIMAGSFPNVLALITKAPFEETENRDDKPERPRKSARVRTCERRIDKRVRV